MAFNGFSRKTWTDRVSEYPTRRILTDTTSQATQQVLVSRDEGTVTSQGDTFDAETMNSLEARIASSFTEDEAAIGNLTNLTTTDKSSLVGAVNEVKASVPPLVDQLNDLDDVSVSPATVGSGDTLIYNGNTAKFEDGQLQAAQVGFTPDTVSTSMPSGFTDVQKAVDYVCELADDVKASKADIQDPAFIGNPTAPTQAAGNNSTRLATTAFVQGEKPSVGSITNLTTVSANTSGWQNVGSFATAKGSKYLIIITAEFAGNATGVRQINISTTSGGVPVDFFRTVGANNMGTVKQQLQLVSILAPSSNTTYSINVAQNSGSGLEIKSKYSLIKLA